MRSIVYLQKKIFNTVSEPNNVYAQRKWTIWHDCGRNTVVELPKSRICHPNPCARRTHPILGCVLRAHGFGWKIRNNGISDPIFCRQASILLCNWGAYRALVWQNKKIDAKSIFRSLEQCHNLALFLETLKIGAASIFVYANTNTLHFAILHIIILYRLQNLVCIFLKLRVNHAHMCVC